MCRTIHDGARRCPSCNPERRSSRDRARYAAKREAAGDRSPSSQDVLPEYVPPPQEVLSPAQIGTRIDQVRSLMLDGDRDAHHELAAWAGSPLHAISRVGASIANDAEHDAGVTATEVAASLHERETYVREQLARIHDLLADEVLQVREASREVAVLQARQYVMKQFPDDFHPDSNLDVELERAQLRRVEAQHRLAEAGRPHDLETLQDQHNRLIQAEDDQTQGELALLAISYRESLQQHVDLGAGGLPWHPDSDPHAVRSLEGASRCFPASWLAAAADGYRVRARMGEGRGSYVDARVTPKFLRTITLPPGVTPADTGLTLFVDDPAASTPSATVWYEVEMEFHEQPDGKLTVSAERPEGTDWIAHGPIEGGYLWRRPATTLLAPPEIHTLDGGQDFRASVHELAHRFESLVPQLGVAQEAFVKGRTMLAAGGQQDPVPMYPGQQPLELVRPDRFTTAYIGRDYGDGAHHEVLSTGVEALFGGRFGGLVAGRDQGPDLDHRGFVLGLLASVPGEGSPGRSKV